MELSKTPIIDALETFTNAMHAISWNRDAVRSLDMKKFVFLLSEPSSAIIAPGLSGRMTSEGMYVCSSEEEKKTLRSYMASVGIKDEASLWNALNQILRSYDEYDTFRTFWAGRPAFDLADLQEEGRMVFEMCMDYAVQLRDIIGPIGLLGWDVNERIGICRKACAAGIITESQFWEATESWANRAAAQFNNWGEYASSVLAGAVYYMFRHVDEEESEEFFATRISLLKRLTSNEGTWRRYPWPQTANEKTFAKQPRDIIPLLTEWQGANGCIASSRIVVDGEMIGYMYREQPINNNDSGWRFMAGDESQEYLDDPDHAGFYALNTLANYDTDIIPFLKEPSGSVFLRINGGPLLKESLPAEPSPPEKGDSNAAEQEAKTKQAYVEGSQDSVADMIDLLNEEDRFAGEDDEKDDDGIGCDSAFDETEYLQTSDESDLSRRTLEETGLNDEKETGFLLQDGGISETDDTKASSDDFEATGFTVEKETGYSGLFDEAGLTQLNNEAAEADADTNLSHNIFDEAIRKKEDEADDDWLLEEGEYELPDDEPERRDTAPLPMYDDYEGIYSEKDDAGGNNAFDESKTMQPDNNEPPHNAFDKTDRAFSNEFDDSPGFDIGLGIFQKTPPQTMNSPFSTDSSGNQRHFNHELDDIVLEDVNLDFDDDE